MTGPWISGESLSPSRLNLHAGAATLVTGFSTDTIQGQSGLTVDVISDLSAQNTLAGQRLELGGAPSNTSGLLSLRANSAQSDYLFLQDATGAKSNFLLGLRTGDSNFSLVDGLNLYDVSHNTMIARFSNDSIRFYPPVVAPVFDTGGALASTYNAALFLPGTSKESQIQAAIIGASNDGIKRVYIPASMYPYSASSISFVYPVQMVREGGPWNVYDPVAYGAAANGIQDDAIALQQCIKAAESSGTLSDGIGSTVFISGGTLAVGSGITMLGQIQVTGTGRTTLIKAIAGTFPIGANLFQMGNGTYVLSSCRLQNVSLDCSGIVATTCVYSSDAQEQSGLVSCVLKGFTRYGANFDGSVGAGCADLYIRDCEFLPSSSATTAISLRLNSSSWKNVVENITIDPGASTNTQPTGIYINNARIAGYGFHVEDCLQAVHFDTGAHGSIEHLDTLGCLRSIRNDAGTSARIVATFVSRTGGSSTISDNANNIHLTSTIIPFYATGEYGFFIGGVDSRSGVTASGTQPQLTLTGNTDVAIVSNTTSGALSNAHYWQMKRNGTIVWRLGTSLHYNTGEFGLYNDSIGTYAMSFHSTTGDATLYHNLTVPNQVTVNGKAQFSVGTGTNGLIVDKTGSAVNRMRVFVGDGTGGTVADENYISNSNTGLHIWGGTSAGTELLEINASRQSSRVTSINYFQSQQTDGTTTAPGYGFLSEVSLGLYRSGASTVAVSYGSFNLNQSRLVSMRTAASLDSTTLAVNEAAFTIVAGSAAQLAIRSGGTVYYFASSSSTKG